MFSAMVLVARVGFALAWSQTVVEASRLDLLLALGTGSLF
jgi:hypothetical protein